MADRTQTLLDPSRQLAHSLRSIFPFEGENGPYDHERTRSKSGLFSEVQADRNDTNRKLISTLFCSESDPRCSGSQRRDRGLVMTATFWKDRDTASQRQDLMTTAEHLRIAVRILSHVLRPNHRDDAAPVEESTEQGILPKHAFRKKPGSPLQEPQDEEGVDEPVIVVRNKKQWALLGQALCTDDFHAMKKCPEDPSSQRCREPRRLALAAHPCIEMLLSLHDAILIG